MLTAIAGLAVRRRKAVLLACLVLFVVAAAFGGNVQEHLSRGGFQDPRSESARAEQILNDQFETGPPNVVLLVEATRGNVDAPDVAAAGAALTEEFATEPAVAEAVSYWTLGKPPPLRSGGGNKALVLGRISGDQDDVIDRIEELSPKYTRDAGPIQIRVGGFAEASRETADTIEQDLLKAESIALPITLLLLIFVFGSAVAAMLPVVIGAFAVVGTFLILRLVAFVTEVSVYSLSATTAMGLALSIDYSLFVVSRYREELRRGLATGDAVVRTLQTAGRTVAFGGMTVAVSLSVLAIFPLAFLRSFAYAGIAVVAFAVARGQQVLSENGFLTDRFARPDGTWLSVVPTVEPISAEGEALVKDVRGTDSPFPVVVAGPSAQLVDSKASLFGRMPVAAGIIGLITFTCLFLMFGSVLVPAKAIVLNALSLTATFGAMVWIFQDGNLSGVLHFTPTGFLNTTIPIMMFCVAFGLSMDYEVFLLSRIKEEHDHGADNVTAVAGGLERTGRIVTAAAALMAIIFVAFATSRISFIKLFGIGLTMAVLMDATLIRGALVPAFMRLAGGANWWSPGPLRRIYDRWGIHELPEPPAATGSDGGDHVSVVREAEPIRGRPPLVTRGTAGQAGRRL